ncbi:MAG: biotin/lipoyl-binding protein, partial [Flavobacteriales bacterium]|nr:biotin/lipoyl-binding protein [Flavobacteriales bacterium]
MLLEMRVPSPGESISEVEIAEWLVEDGDYVEKDQSIAEIDSDKATLELPAEESGTIKIVVGDGETVAVGDVVCIIDTSGKGEAKLKSTKEETTETTETPKSAEKSEGDLVGAKATPLASVMISEHDISAKQLKGTGEKGKITKSDVLGVIKGTSTDRPRGTSRKKMSSLRRKIASRLVTVKNETAMLTTFNEVDMT